MAPASPALSTTPVGRRRGRPPGTTNAARLSRPTLQTPVSEPPLKKRRYVPGGPGGGGRFIQVDAFETTSSAAGTATASRARNAARDTIKRRTPSTLPRRERRTRTRPEANHDTEPPRWGSVAATVASVKQADDYKPREERNWEEFHPKLDIEKSFMVFTAEEVDGAQPVAPATPAVPAPNTPLLNGSVTPSRPARPGSAGNTTKPSEAPDPNAPGNVNEPMSRRPRRQTRDVSLYSTRPLDLSTPRTLKILPIHSQTPKERLDMKLPSYRKTNRVDLFESKTFGQARYVDKAMSNVGYQESDQFLRPEVVLIKSLDVNAEDEADLAPISKAEDAALHARLGRVEYDMDEQDDMWLEQYNIQRKHNELEVITREVFEITMTKIEKEWHALEKRIPKPNPKPPQTHRPRFSSAAAVNGETQNNEEPDSKCAVCDDGDCENTNAIVFCDGCNLAVHQECYGVPFIPEGQWLCRKCQLCGRGIPICIFCPNTDGAFKQTNSSKWAHLLCAMWIPEVSLGNHTFMEPVMEMEKVPKTRWKLSCYICHQKMGACIQCGNKNCYQAFHVTCARRARLYLKMKTTQGTLAILDGSMVLKAFCDKHCPLEYSVEHDVHQATRAAKKFYKRNMRGRIWADNHAIASILAAQHRNAITEHPPDECQMTGARNSAVLGDKKKSGGQPPKNLWRLPSGAPIIPQTVFDVVEASIQRFSFRKRKDFLSEACRYWTLKREARRGAALLKRLQLQMETFSSMELTRRNFASMGPSGKTRLARRVEFTESIIRDLEQLKVLCEETVQREQIKVDASELEQEFVDECYFPVAKLLVPAIEKAMTLDKELFSTGLRRLRTRVNQRYYVTAISFAQDLREVISAGVATALSSTDGTSQQSREGPDAAAAAPPSKAMFLDIRERRKLGKRILKALQPLLDNALRVESEIYNKPYEKLRGRLKTIIVSNLDARDTPGAGVVEKQEGEEEDTPMVDAPQPSSETAIQNSLSSEHVRMMAGDANIVDSTEGDGVDSPGGNTEVKTLLARTGTTATTNGTDAPRKAVTDVDGDVGGSLETLPDSNGFESLPRPAETGPPTPPQSNGSFDKEANDALAEGGILWYLQSMQPEGTSILGEHWATGRDAVRMLSEDLTDLDDEELKGLGAEVDESVTAAAAVVALDTEVAVVSEKAAGAGPTRSKGSNGGGGGGGGSGSSSRTRKRRASGRRR